MLLRNPLFLLALALAAISTPASLGLEKKSSAPPDFQKLILTDKYYCDGITAADINRDGKIDIVAGSYWYQGPDFKTKHEFYPAKEFTLPPSPTDSMFSYVHDFNGDGWPDILVLGRVHLHPAYWYENPGKAGGLWKKHFVFERIKGESPPFLDVDGDGKPEIVAHWDDHWGLIHPDWSDPTKPWKFKPITDQGKWEQFYHGTGIGDVNGDGRNDLILNEGWYEQPADHNAPWIRHEFKFGDKGGAQMFVYDVNGDGRNDIITSLDAHGWGLAWFENISENGGITFKKHVIMGDRSEEAKYGVAFSQPHALVLADIDGDGLLDIVVGKRLWAHGPQGDIEPNEKPLLYWFKLTRDGQGGATFTPHLVDDQSGVGVQLTVADLNGDGRPDILTVSKLGAFAFINQAPAPNANAAEKKTIRVAAAQPRARLVDWHVNKPREVLARLGVSLTELEGLMDQAAKQHCDVVALPEDTLGLGNWEAGNEPLLREVLPQAVEKMLKRFGAWAAKHQMYVVCCNDHAEPDGKIYNTSFFIGRDGKEIGRYRKVCPTLHERIVTPGDRFPVFNTTDLGGVGMLICYDMVFPETARCLALGGADIIFHPTLGGAAIGDDDISRAAFRTRAVENFVYLVVAQRGSGSMIVSPQGKIIVEAKGVDTLAVADIDPFGGREGGDAMNHQRDIRARLFRERNPAAFGILTDPNPPVLAKVPATITEREAVDIAHKVLTVGLEEFQAADALLRAGKTRQAIDAFTRLKAQYRDSWIDRVATERLEKLQPQKPATSTGGSP